MNRFSILTMTIILTIPVVLHSATIHVPADFPTIQQAIDAAVSRDLILVDPGTYAENINFLNKNISIMSTSGAVATVIDGGGTDSTVKIGYGVGPESVFEGFTITNGGGSFGSGIACYGDPTIRDNILTGNTSPYGGGITCFGSPAVLDNLITGNTGNYGGGVYSNHDAVIMDNMISENTSPYMGSGIFCKDGSPHIIDNIIKENSTTASWGGGIHCLHVAATIRNNLITGNTADHGAGISIYFSTGVLLENNTITRNDADGRGGAIYLLDSTAALTNNVLTSNTAEVGGGICSYGSTLTLVNDTLYQNTAVAEGGGLYAAVSSNITVENSILWNNAAPVGPGAVLESTYSPSTLTIDYCDLEGGPSSVYLEPGCILDFGSHMIDADPLFVDPANDDIHLAYPSPCRDTGNNSAATQLTDFEGDPRIAYGTVDMGADEFNTHLYVTGDKTPSGSIQGKFVGLPGTTPVGLFIGTSTLPSPINTMWGEYWLQAPWLLFGPLGVIPSDGVMVLPTTLPSGMTVPVDIPMQALIGLNAESLSNLCMLEVR